MALKFFQTLSWKLGRKKFYELKIQKNKKMKRNFTGINSVGQETKLESKTHPKRKYKTVNIKEKTLQRRSKTEKNKNVPKQKFWYLYEKKNLLNRPLTFPFSFPRQLFSKLLIAIVLKTPNINING